MANFNNNNNNNQYSSLRIPLYPYTTSKGNSGLKGFQTINGQTYMIKVFDPAPDKRGNKYENVAYLTKYKANQKDSKVLPL